MTGKEKIIERIKDAGQELIDRAEEIASGEYMTNLDIHIYLDANEEYADEISWTTTVVNMNRCKRYFKKGD